MIKQRILEEVENYEEDRDDQQYQMGILSFLEEAATGGMKELIRDIGIHPDNLSFVNVGDLQKQRD